MKKIKPLKKALVYFIILSILVVAFFLLSIWKNFAYPKLDKIYSNSQVGYSFKYPGAWTADFSQSDQFTKYPEYEQRLFTNNKFLEPAFNACRKNLNGNDVKSPCGPLSPEVDIQIGITKNNTDPYDIDSCKQPPPGKKINEIMVAGQPVCEYDTGSLGEETPDQTISFFTRNGTNYSLTLTGPTGLTTYNAILSSFQFFTDSGTK